MIRRLLLLCAFALLTGIVLAQNTPLPITAESAEQVQFISDILADDIVNDIAFSPDGTLLVTAGQDTSVRVWSLADNSQVTEAFEHFSFVKDAVFTESLLATSGWDKTLITWQMVDGTLTPQAQFGGFEGVVENLAVSPDSALIAFGVGDGRVRVAESTGGAIRFELPVGALRVTAVAYSPDGTQIAAAGGFPSTGALVWDAATGEQIAVLAHPATVTALAYSPSGEVLAVAGEDGTVTLWRDNQQISAITAEDWVTDIAFTPDGTALITARQDGVMIFWNVSDPDEPILSVAIVAADQAINAVAFNAEGTLLATAASDGSVRLWQVK